jgi:parvulin-like peptidyl-prolyl isomerase
VSKRDIALVPESRLASHILLMCRDECDKEAVKGDLAAIRQRILDGEDFSALAEELSEDPMSAQNGGTLKTEIQRDNARIDESFREAVFTLSEVGE